MEMLCTCTLSGHGGVVCMLFCVRPIEVFHTCVFWDHLDVMYTLYCVRPLEMLCTCYTLLDWWRCYLCSTLYWTFEIIYVIFTCWTFEMIYIVFTCNTYMDNWRTCEDMLRLYFMILHKSVEMYHEHGLLRLTDPWRWVMSWKDIMPIAPMVTILDAKFFPKWLQVGSSNTLLIANALWGSYLKWTGGLGKFATAFIPSLWESIFSFFPQLELYWWDLLHIEGSGPEWYISSMLFSRDIPFWSGTLDMWPFIHHKNSHILTSDNDTSWRGLWGKCKWMGQKSR